MTHISASELAARWTASAAQAERAIAAETADGYVGDVAALTEALADAQLLGAKMAEAIERGFPVERALLLAAEALLRAVHRAEPALVAREVERVLALLADEEPITDELLPEHAHAAVRALQALLAVGYPRFFAGRTAA